MWLEMKPLLLNEGRVIYKSDNHYIIRTSLYDFETYCDEDMLLNELISYNIIKYNDYRDDISKKNKCSNMILFQKQIELLDTEQNLSLKYFGSNLETLSEQSRAYIMKILCGFNDYENLTPSIFFFGFVPYLIVRLCNRYKLYKFSILFILFNLIFFRFNAQLCLGLLQSISLMLRLNNKKKRLNFIIVLTLFICPFYFLNYAYLFHFLNYFIRQYHFERGVVYMLCQTYLFGSIGILRNFYFRFMQYLAPLIYILSLLLIIFKELEAVYSKILNLLLSTIGYLDFRIYGRLNLLCILLLVASFKIFKINNRYLKMIVIIMCLIFRIQTPLNYLTMIDVGQGLCMLYEDRLNDITLMFDTADTNNYYKVKNYLNDYGISKIDYLIITHGDSDHSANLDKLKSDFRIENIITEGRDIKVKNLQLKYFKVDDINNINQASLVYLFNIDNKNILITGDIDSYIERQLIKNYSPLKIDILQVAHHGSKSSSSSIFIDEIQPRISLISTSGKYNHPNQDVVKRLGNCGDVFITKDEEDICYIFGKFVDILISRTKFVVYGQFD